MSLVLASVRAHRLVPSDAHGLNKREPPSQLRGFKQDVAAACSVKITGVNTRSGSDPDFFNTSFLLHLVLFGPSGLEIRRHCWFF